MDIPGKLRADIQRIFGRHDPMDHIEDARVETGPDGTTIQMILRVPDHLDRYVKSSPLYGSCAGFQDEFAYEMDFMDKLFSASVWPRQNPHVSKEKVAIDSTKPERVVYSGPYTHVFWPDGSKTSVKLAEGQEFDEYTAFCAAMTKKMFGGSTPKAKKFLDSVKVFQKRKKKDDGQLVIAEFEEAPDVL